MSDVALLPLRTLAALPRRDASTLLKIAEHRYLQDGGRAARHGFRRITAYQRFLGLLPPGTHPSYAQEQSGLTAEHRRAPRQDVFRLGELHLDRSSDPVDCLVRDASAAGALIEVEHTMNLPDRFNLTIRSTGLSKPCWVVRRLERYVAVSFSVDQPDMKIRDRRRPL